MKKTYIFTAVIALIASVGLMAPAGVFAQYYYTTAPVQYTQPVQYGVGSCVNLTSNLYKGLRDASVGGQISALQSFLISQRYLAISAPTGYFGALTVQAVAQYQVTHGIPSDGTVGVLTRGSINSVSCGNNSGNNYNNNYGYNNYYGAPVANSLSATSGSVGNSITIYGSGFDLYNNTVNFGGVTIPGIPSYAGTALAFVVPQVNQNSYNYYNSYNYSNPTGTYSVSVTSSRGTSNSLQFTVNGYNHNNCYNYSGYNNNYNNCYNNGSISISNVSGPTTLTTGTVGTWSLTLYNPNSNYVSVSATWGDENTYNSYGYASSQAAQSSRAQGQQTISFTHTYQTSGYYTVTFTATDNNGAQTTASATVNVSGYGYIQAPAPYLTSINPSSGRVGTQVTLYGSGFTPTGNVVHFGNGGTSNISASNGGNTIYYTIPYDVGPCDITNSNGGPYCAAPVQIVTPGRYAVYVSNTYGQTSTIYFNVTY